MEHTEDNIETQITLSTSFLKMFVNFQMILWHDYKNIEENVVVNIAIRCIKCVKITSLSVKNTNKIYKYMITKFVLLHHIGM